MPKSPVPLRWSSAQQTATLSSLYVFLRGQITPLSVPEDLVQKQISKFPTNLLCSTAFLPQCIGSTQACSTPCNISSILLTSNIIFVSLQHKVVKNKQTKTHAQKQKPTKNSSWWESVRSFQQIIHNHITWRFWKLARQNMNHLSHRKHWKHPITALLLKCKHDFIDSI